MFVAGEVAEWLGPGVDPEAALTRGVLARVKVQGRWLYYSPEDADLEDALDTLIGAVAVVLDEWLLNPAQYLVGQALKTPNAPKLSHAACRLLIFELCHRHRLDGLALMSQRLEPYLAFYMPNDQAEIVRQVDALHTLIDERGAASWRELPAPLRPVTRSVWRSTVIAHGEWLGLGYQRKHGLLEAW